jgi:hypothetical protein
MRHTDELLEGRILIATEIKPDIERCRNNVKYPTSERLF